MGKKLKNASEKYDPKEWDDEKSVSVAPEPKMKSGISTSIRLPKEMVSKLRRIANSVKIKSIQKITKKDPL